MQQHGGSHGPTPTPAPSREPMLLVDAAIGVAGQAVAGIGAAGRVCRSVVRPVTHVVLQPPLVPRRLQPAAWLSRIAAVGAGYRHEVAGEIEELLDAIVPTLVSEMVRRVDLTELVQENVELVEVTRDVIADIDLPEIIRDSTGAVASGTLLGVRMQSISGDDAVTRAVERLRLRLARRVVGPES